MKNSTNGWQRYSLEELSETINYGLTASAVHREDGPRFLRITDIQDNTVKWASVPSCNASRNELVQCQLQAGDIVFARTGATTGKSFLIRNCPNEAVFASYLIRVRPGNRINPIYLSHYFNTPEYWAQIQKEAQGAGQPGVNSTKLKTLSIPLPPLPEQRRIADILDKADAIRRKQEKGIWFTEELLRSTFLEMFGDPAMNPKGWPIHVMGEVVKDTQYGTAEKSNSAGTGIPVLRMNNITYGGDIDLSNIKWSKIKETDFDQLTVKRGDLLFNRTNSPELVGKTAVWDRDEPYAYAGYLFRVRFDEKVAMPDYISAFLNSAYGKKMLFAKAKPSNNMSNLSAGEFCRIELPVPDIALQRRFSKTVAQTKHLKAKQVTAWKETESLFGSLVQRAFQGEL